MEGGVYLRIKNVCPTLVLTFQMTKREVREKQFYKRSRDSVCARDNERKGHTERTSWREEVNKAGERQEREKERAIEGCC